MKSYPKELEGKTTDRKGNVTGSYYPNWRSVVPNLDGSEALDVNIGALHRFVRGVLKHDKNKDASVVVRDGAGHLSVYRAKGLDLFLRAAELCGADVRLAPLDYAEGGYLLAFSNENGIALMMPLATGDLRDIESLYAFDGAKEGAVKEQKAGSNTVPLTDLEAALRDGVNELMREAGIEVIDDEKEGQRVLDMANGHARMMSFGEPYDYEKYPLGRVEPGISNKEVGVVSASANHGFANYKEAKAWAKENVAKTYDTEETGGKGEVSISNRAVDKFLSQSAVDKSDSKDVHLAVLKVLPDVLKESIDVETHPDFLKGTDGKRSLMTG